MKKIINLILAILLAGCSRNSSSQNNSYFDLLEKQGDRENYTVAVHSQYELNFGEKRLDSYSQDAVLVKDQLEATIKQNINAKGMTSTLSGEYYDGTLYNTYNGVQYYEKMEFSKLVETLLVPIFLDKKITAKDIKTISEEQGTYTIQYEEAKAKEIFLKRYNSYGLNAEDIKSVKRHEIKQKFVENQLESEKVKYILEVTRDNQTFEINFQSSMEYSQVGTSQVNISSEKKEKNKSFMAFNQIDTSKIQLSNNQEDAPESTALATLKKRLVNRLGYTKQSEHEYVNKFNSNQEYSFLFNNDTFQYKNYSIVYNYNWKSDIASTAACTYDFKNGTKSNECSDDNLVQFKKVRDYLKLELYYCGLAIADFMESKK